MTAQFIWRDVNGKVRSSIKPANVKLSKKERKEVQNSQGNFKDAAAAAAGYLKTTGQLGLERLGCQLTKKFLVAHFEVPIWGGKLAKKIFDLGAPCGRGTRLKLRYP